MQGDFLASILSVARCFGVRMYWCEYLQSPREQLFLER